MSESDSGADGESEEQDGEDEEDEVYENEVKYQYSQRIVSQSAGQGFSRFAESTFKKLKPPATLEIIPADESSNLKSKSLINIQYESKS